MAPSTKRAASRLGTIVLWVFALIGFAVTSIFIASRLGLFDVRGSVESHKAFVANEAIAVVPKSLEGSVSGTDALLLCETLAIARHAPHHAQLIREGWQRDGNVARTSAFINAVAKELELTTEIRKALQDCQAASEAIAAQSETIPVFSWLGSQEAVLLKAALTKDAPVINEVAARTGVSSRLIASTVLPEQLRFFTTKRGAVKSYLEPLQALGVLTRFSLGVSGIKLDTAEQIEAYANDPASPFYPGPGDAQWLAFPDDVTPAEERYRRLTDTGDRRYQYLYTALFLKEVLAQWKRAGFDITHAPQVSVTIFNLGFVRSQPKPNPRVGGVPVTVGGEKILFGQLGYEFYYSGELLDVFPFEAPSSPAAASATASP